MKHYLVWMLIFSATAQASSVFVSKDANGNVIFSDQPTPNSQEYDIGTLPTVPAVTAPISLQQPAQVSEPSFSYTSLSIITPTNGQSIPPGYASNVEVSGVLSPGLRDADTIYLLDNGSVIHQGRQTSFHLTELTRGEHVLQIQVRDSTGKILKSSNSVTIFVHRPSVLQHRAAP